MGGKQIKKNNAAITKDVVFLHFPKFT